MWVHDWARAGPVTYDIFQDRFDVAAQGFPVLHCSSTDSNCNLSAPSFLMEAIPRDSAEMFDDWVCEEISGSQSRVILMLLEGLSFVGGFRQHFDKTRSKL